MRGHTQASLAPPALSCAHHRSSRSPAGARARHPELSRPGRWSANFLRVVPATWHLEVAEKQFPNPPETSEEDAAAGGSEGRGDTAELRRRDRPRLKFLPSRCLFSGSIASGFPLASSRLPVSSLSSPTQEYLKGPRGTSPASLHPVWQVLVINISSTRQRCPTAPSGEKETAQIRNPSKGELLSCFSRQP